MRVVIFGAKQVGADTEAEIERIEDSLSRLIEGFGRYRSQHKRAYDYAQALLSRAAQGFLSPLEATLHEERQSHALQNYFRLREQIDWWLGEIRQVAAALAELEQRETAGDAPVPCLQPQGREEGPGMPFIELNEVF